MPKNKKKGKREADDLDDILAQIRTIELTWAHSTESKPAIPRSAISRSAMIAGANKGLARTPLNSATTGTGWIVSEKVIGVACMTGNIAQLKRWRRQGVRVTTAGPLCSALHCTDPLDVLYCLVKELGADVHQRDDDGYTALNRAAYYGHHDTVAYLVENLGADVNIADERGSTPFVECSI
jgi:hypothetical protein